MFPKINWTKERMVLFHVSAVLLLIGWVLISSKNYNQPISEKDIENAFLENYEVFPFPLADRILRPEQTPGQSPVEYFPGTPVIDSPATESPETPGEPASFSVSTKEEPVLWYPSKHFGPAGTKISLTGSGFLPQGNKVNLGYHSIDKLKSDGGTQINFYVPQITPGKYYLSVTTANGTTEPETPFVVTDPNSRPPTITGINPKVVSYGEEVSVSGTGFSSEGNDIVTSFGIIENISSPDGTTLKFKADPFSKIPQAQIQSYLNDKNSPLMEFPVWIMILNKDGVSNEEGTFNLRL